ncbi:uncharacterized protein LOC143293665 isoform X2 [Babylonia areolata]
MTSMDSEVGRVKSSDMEGERPSSRKMEPSDRRSFFYICSLCDFSCDTAIDFTMHLNSDHHNETVFPCYHCNYGGEYTTDLTNHMNSHTSGESNIYLCPCFWNSCNYRTDSLHNIRQHLVKHQDCNIFKCSRCKSTFTDGMQFLQHAQQNSLTLYTCTKCASRFMEKAAIQHHWRTSHSGGRVFRVLKILLCRERQIHGYGHDSCKDGVRLGSVTVCDIPENVRIRVKPELRFNEKASSEDENSDARTHSNPLASRPVLDVESEVPVSGECQNDSSFHEITEDTAISGINNTCPRKKQDHNSQLPENEPSSVVSLHGSRHEVEERFVVLSVPDPDETDYDHHAVGCELEREDSSEQKQSQLNLELERKDDSSEQNQSQIEDSSSDQNQGQLDHSEGQCEHDTSAASPPSVIISHESRHEVEERFVVLNVPDVDETDYDHHTIGCRLEREDSSEQKQSQLNLELEREDSSSEQNQGQQDIQLEREDSSSEQNQGQQDIQLEREDSSSEQNRSQIEGSSSEQNHGQLDHSEGQCEHDTSAASPTSVIISHMVLSDVNCHQEDQHPQEECESDGVGSNSTKVHMETVPSDYDDKATCEKQVCVAVDQSCDHVQQQTSVSSVELAQNGSTKSTPSEVAEREVSPAAVEREEVPVMTRQESIRLTELLGSDELHRALSGQLYHEDAGHFSCAFCDKRFDRIDCIHMHLFVHCNVPLYSCSFCSLETSSIAQMKRHFLGEHPGQERQIKYLLVKKADILQTLEEEKPLTIQKFITICCQLAAVNQSSQYTLTSALRTGGDSISVAGGGTEAVDQADNVRNDIDIVNQEVDARNERTATNKRNDGKTEAVDQVDNVRNDIDTVNQDDDARNERTATNKRNDGSVVSKKGHLSERPEDHSAVSDVVISQPSDGHAHCGVRSLNRSTSVCRRSAEAGTSFQDSEEHQEHATTKDSRKIHALAAKPHSSALYMPKTLQNSKGKVQHVGRPKSGTYTVVKEGSLLKLKCKACGDMTLSQSSMVKHLETCRPYINSESASDQTNYAGSLARQMRTNGSLVSDFFGNMHSNETDPLQTKHQSRGSLDPVSLSDHAEHSDHSGKAHEIISQKTGSEKKASELSSKKVVNADKVLSLQPKKSLGLDGVEGEDERINDVEDYQTSAETSHVESAYNQSGDEAAEEDDIVMQRTRKRRVQRLQSSSDEEGSEDQMSANRHLDVKEGEIGRDSEQISQCKLCEFAAPSSHINELQDHICCKHKRLLSLIKCGYCSVLYGKLSYLKRHINSVHAGQPELKEEVSICEFFRIQEKENCSPKQKRIRSEPKSKLRRVEKDGDAVMIVEDDTDQENSVTNCDKKRENKNFVSSSGTLTTSDILDKGFPLIPPPTGTRNVTSHAQTNSTVKSPPEQNRNTMHSSLEDDDTSYQSTGGSPAQMHGEQQGLCSAKTLPVQDSGEVRTSLTSEETKVAEHTAMSARAKVGNKKRSGCSLKASTSVSKRKRTAEPEMSPTQGPSSALKSRMEGKQADEQSMDDDEGKKTSCKRYRCVKCAQVHPDYRSLKLHLSRHLDYCSFVCCLCHKKFASTNEAQKHHEKKHPGELFSHKRISHPDKEKKLKALIQASVMEGSDGTQACTGIPGKKSEQECKQSLQCTKCQMVLDSPKLFKRHCVRDHGMERSMDRMHWLDIQSQIVYDLCGNPISTSPDHQTSVYSYLCGFCSWRFVDRNMASEHSTEKHQEVKKAWVLRLRSAASQETGLQTSAERLVTATTSLEMSMTQKRETSSDSSPASSASRDVSDTSGTQGNEMLLGSFMAASKCCPSKCCPKIVLKDFLKTGQLQEFTTLLQLNGVTSFHLGDRLSDEKRTFLMRFIPKNIED